MDILILSQRLQYAKLQPDHADGPYLRWMNDPEITKFLEARFQGYVESDLRDYIRAASVDESVLLLGIFLRQDGSHIGNVKLNINREHQRAEIGLLIGDKDQWRKGYATEAINAVTQYAFDSLELHKVTAGCYGSNRAAIASFLKAGFEKEGQRSEHYLSDGRWVDHILLGRIAEKPRAMDSSS